MKRISTSIFILATGIFMLTLSGCKTNSQLQCPDLASTKKMHTPILALNHNHIAKSSKPAEQVASTQQVQTGLAKANPTASADQIMNFKIKMPNALSQNIQSDQDLDDMNKILATYSNNKVVLQRNDKGKLLLKAHSLKDIFALAKNVSHPQGYYERRYGSEGGAGTTSGAAIASSILGPIGFVFAFIPFLCLPAIPISIAAIITGGIGLNSPRRHRAVVGLTFGILGLIFSLLFTWLYFAFWAFFVL